MPNRFASCSCGQLSAQVTGDFVRHSICHCLNCQKRTGSPFAQQVRFQREHVAVSGSSTAYVRAGDSGNKATFHFCPTCGDTVYYEMDALPQHVAIPVGAFADPAFPTPTVSVYESRKHSWIVPPPDAEHY